MKINVNKDKTLSVNQEAFFTEIEHVEPLRLFERFHNRIDLLEKPIFAKKSFTLFELLENEKSEMIPFTFTSLTSFVDEDKEMFIFTSTDEELTFFYSFNSDELWGFINTK